MIEIDLSGLKPGMENTLSIIVSNVIRKAFSTGNVDITVAGDLEDVEISLGLRTKRETPQPNYIDPDYEDLANVFDSFTAKKKKIGRNAPCPCGSGKKYKKCCLNKNN